MTMLTGFENVNIAQNAQRVIDMYHQDFVVEQKPSSIIFEHQCGQLHRLVHKGNTTIFFCGGKEMVYVYPKMPIVSITPSSTPDASPMTTPERATKVYGPMATIEFTPTAYIIPQRRFTPVSLFNQENA